MTDGTMTGAAGGGSAGWTGVRDKRVLLTGATRGIGLAAAEELARRGARLALVARDAERGKAALRRVRTAGGEDAELFVADLSVQAEVRRLAAEVLDRYASIQVLINNAGAMFTARRETPDGRELTWALNHLAPFLLTNLLRDRLIAGAPARIITTASAAHVGAQLPLDDLDGRRRYAGWSPLKGFARYGETKLANILFTAELGRRLAGTGVTAYCFHPGFVASGFNRNNGLPSRLGMGMLRPLARTPEKGAATLVWLADTPGIEAHSGGYFTDRRPATPSRAARDAESARRLWEISEEQTAAS